MASHSLFIKRSAARELEHPPLEDRKRVVVKIQRLAQTERDLYLGCEPWRRLAAGFAAGLRAWARRDEEAASTAAAVNMRPRGERSSVD